MGRDFSATAYQRTRVHVLIIRLQIYPVTKTPSVWRSTSEEIHKTDLSPTQGSSLKIEHQANSCRSLDSLTSRFREMSCPLTLKKAELIVSRRLYFCSDPTKASKNATAGVMQLTTLQRHRTRCRMLTLPTVNSPRVL